MGIRRRDPSSFPRLDTVVLALPGSFPAHQAEDAPVHRRAHVGSGALKRWAVENCVTFVLVLLRNMRVDGIPSDALLVHIVSLGNDLAAGLTCAACAVLAFNFQWAWSSGTVVGRAAASPTAPGP